MRQRPRAAGGYQGVSDPEGRALLWLLHPLFILVAAPGAGVPIKRQRTSQPHQFMRKNIMEEPARAVITCLQVILITESKTNYVVHQFSLFLQQLRCETPGLDKQGATICHCCDTKCLLLPKREGSRDLGQAWRSCGSIPRFVCQTQTSL